MAYVKKPIRIKIPFLQRGKKVGLGDAIARGTSAVGIKPCGGCKKRAVWLNGKIVFVGSE